MAGNLIHMRWPQKIELGIDLNPINTIMMSSQGGRKDEDSSHKCYRENSALMKCALPIWFKMLFGLFSQKKKKLFGLVKISFYQEAANIILSYIYIYIY